MNEETLFHLAREKPPDQRAAFLDEACAGDTALRERLEILLTAHEHPASFLKPATRENGNGDAQDGGRTVYQSGVQEGPGTIIDPYKLLQQIGEGGMGVVFMAEQTEPIQRTVALKIIKPGMDTRQVIARFEAERQALAMMDHPNIARVVDAGTTDTGRPYFVMELVKGVPITKYCDDQKLSLRERLALFKPVCEAVQHAHQKGIIHRDIKPTNVLVAEYDNRAVPKVIDFGVAKATAQKLTERTMFTEFGQVIGTVEYMSPEQAKLNQLDIDTRSDIYSLGVLLYELLTGSTPFERQRLREAAFDEVLRIIREEEPPKPSTKLSASDTLPSVAANRHTEPARLSKDVRGELDWIVMKCLEKDRNRRYETANGTARDIDRYLADEPVQACPPSATYRFRKFARRNKAALLLASVGFAVLLLILAGLAISNRLIAAERNAKAAALEERERALADAEAQRQRAEKSFWRASIAIRELMTKTAIGKDGVSPAVRKRFSDEAVKYFQSLLQESSPNPALRNETGVGYRALGMLHHSWQEPKQAEECFRQSIAILEQLCTEHPSVQEYRQQLGYAYFEFGKLLVGLRRPKETQSVLKRGAEIYEKLLAEKPDSHDYIAELADVHKWWFFGNLSAGQLQDAERSYRRSVELFTALADGRSGADPYPSGQSRVIFRAYAEELQRLWALALVRAERSNDAEQIFRDALRNSEKINQEDPGSIEYRIELIRSHYNLSNVLRSIGRSEEAEQVRRRASSLEQSVLDAAKFGDSGEVQNEMAWTLVTDPYPGWRSPRLAVALAERAVAALPGDGNVWNTLGVARYRNDRWKEAIAAFDKSMELRNGGNANDWFFLAMCHWQLGEKDEARTWYEKAVEWTEKNQPKNTQLRRFRTEAEELLKTADKEPAMKVESKRSEEKSGR